MKINWTMIILIVCVAAWLFFFDGMKVVQDLISGFVTK